MQFSLGDIISGGGAGEGDGKSESSGIFAAKVDKKPAPQYDYARYVTTIEKR